MKRASDFRTIARDALRGKWGLAVLAGFLASLLGATGTSSRVNINTGNSNSGYTVNLQELIPAQMRGILAGAIVGIVVVGIVLAIGWTILSSVVNAGYAKFNLRMVDREEASINVMFSCFPQWKTVTVANLLQGLFIFLWTLALIIPGIIACYTYAMVPYILAEYPEMPAGEVLAQSKMLMEGNRWRLFCMHLSFIGWALLAIMTLGIGNLWLTPYRQTAEAAFYREISGTERHFSEDTSYETF